MRSDLIEVPARGDVLTHDLVIRNGLVVDGTGAPGRVADVAIDGDRITAIGQITDGGAEEIDATGLVVTPGFVDPHTHLDAQLCWDPYADPSSLHGVTTVLMGMCGFGIAPSRPGAGEYLLRSLEMVEEIPFESTSQAVPFAWSTWPEFLEYLETRPVAVNFGGMVPHSALRYYVMGDRARSEEATEAERLQLAQELRRSLDGGALGFATSRGPNHLDAFGNPVPSRFADDEELRALVMECRGRPWQVNLMTKIAPTAAPVLEEVDRYAKWTADAGARLTWSPFFAEPSEGVWREVLEHHHDVLAAKTVVVPQVSPCALTSVLRFDNAAIERVVGWGPAVAGFSFLSRQDQLGRLGDADFRELLRQAPARDAELSDLDRKPVDIRPNYDSWTIIESDRPELLGLTLTQAAATTNVAPSDFLCDIAIADDLEISLQVPVVNDDWRGAAVLCDDDATLIGLGDSGAHVSTVTSYVYTTDLLARLVRDEAVLTLESAVRRLTSEPARFFGVPGRGELRVGNFADLCVIDLEALSMGRTEVRHDLPGGAMRVHRSGHGYAAVVVNGQITIDHDKFTGNLPGRAVRPEGSHGVASSES
jgi:N-acyl-D-amino-acid deacylase